MRTNRADPPKKVLQMKNDNTKDNHKVSRRLRREISTNKGLMEDYYHEGVPVSVPFRWESEPGTPKTRFRDSPLPPLTPPPSYYNSPKSPIRKNPKPKKTNSLLGKVFTKKKNDNPSSSSSFSSSSYSSSSSSSSASSSYSVPSSPMIRASNFRGRCEMSSPRLSYDSRARYEEEHECESHNNNVSTALCFSRGSNARPRGWYSYLIKLLLKNPQ